MSTTDSTEQGPRRLQRSRDDRVVAGVCGGIARYFDVDPTLVRVVTVALLAFGGFGAFAYLAAWLLVPEQGSVRPLLGRDDQGRAVQIAGIVVLAVVGVIAVGAWIDVGFVFGGWPLLLLVTGGAVFWFVSERGEREEPAAPLVAAARADAGADAGAVASDADGDDDTLVQDPAAAAPAPAPERRRRGSWAVTAIATGGVCLALGAAGVLEASGVVELGWGGLVAIAIVLTGVALVASAFFGGARGLIPVGILLALVLGSTAAAGVSFNGGIGERDYRVADGDLLRGRYELGIGHLQLDLREIELARGTTHVTADLDVGMLEIVAPGARFEGGDASLRDDDDGRGEGGIDVRRTIVVGSGDRLLEIDAHVGAGMVAVTRKPGGGEGWDWSSRTGPATRSCLGLGFATTQSACEGGRDAA